MSGLDGDVLPGWWRGVNAFLDCLRSSHARPTVGQRAFYSGYDKQHSTTRAVVTSPTGLFLGVGEALGGRRNDQYCCHKANVAFHLVTADLLAGGDKAFVSVTGPNGAGIASLPKANHQHTLTAPQLAVLAALRTAGAEWPFG
jgi:hypothetical protein